MEYLNENSAWDHCLIPSPGMIIFYGNKWDDYTISIEPRNITVFKTAMLDLTDTYADITLCMRDHPFAPGILDVGPADIFYYDDI